MIKTSRILSVTVGAVLFAGLAQASNNSGNSGDIKPVKDQRALTELKRMGEALSAAHSMSFDTTSMSPLRGPNGQWIHVLKTSEVKMQRPNRLMIKMGGDAVKQNIFFDGKTYSVDNPEHKIYSQEEMPGSIDEMLAKAFSKGGDSFAFADVLLADPYSSWTKDLDGAIFVGDSDRQGEKLTHLALTEKGVDWEVFIDQKTHLPRIVYVKYTDLERSPSILIEFSKWKTNPKISPTTFAFVAPADAKKAQFKAPKGAN